ncbi:MAG: ABC transporter permease [Candidatus Limnocylindrales bacterium]
MTVPAVPRNARQSRVWRYLASGASPILAVVLAVIVGGGVVLASGANPVTAYQQMLVGAVGTPFDISETFVSSIPLILAAYAVSFAFRGGLFNIGAEGQLYMGAIASTWVATSLSGWPGLPLILLAMLAAMAAGGAWAGIAGWLKARTGAHEVITTMMLSYVAIDISHWLLEAGPMTPGNAFGTPESGPIPPQAAFPILIPSWILPNARLNASLLLTILAGLAFAWILWRTPLGYEIRAVGLNAKAAAYGGINVARRVVVAMVIAGAFAGLAGMVPVWVSMRLYDSFSPGYGYEAIAVALVGRNSAIGIFLAGLLYGAMIHGSVAMQANANISGFLVEILQALVLFFVGAEMLTRWILKRGGLRALAGAGA